MLNELIPLAETKTGGYGVPGGSEKRYGRLGGLGDFFLTEARSTSGPPLLTVLCNLHDLLALVSGTLQPQKTPTFMGRSPFYSYA
jgi:hypothetical protein